MSKIAVLTDSSAYLPPELVEQYGIHVIPVVAEKGHPFWKVCLDTE